jgi:hypothetical protein
LGPLKLAMRRYLRSCVFVNAKVSVYIELVHQRNERAERGAMFTITSLFTNGGRYARWKESRT